MRKIILILLLLIISTYLVSPVSIFEYKETDFVSLQPDADDPDNQELTYTFSPPLDENGEWQTDYGDAGEYNVTITVSDGELSASENIMILINKNEQPPEIINFAPDKKDISIIEGNKLNLKIDAKDANKDSLTYYWELDNNRIGKGKEIEILPDYSMQGEHIIKATVSDGESEVIIEWNLIIEDLDIDSLLEGIEDITITETETAKLKLPDFDKYNLKYSISDPLGSDNFWITGYDDEGEYIIDIEVEGKGYSGSDKVKITVLDKDRLPKFNIGSLFFVSEEDTLEIILNASDDDGDDITFTVSDLPEDAEFVEDTFRWKPDFDYVTKDSIIDEVLDRFRVLSRSKTITFSAITEKNTVEKKVRIIVQDNNRPFELEKFDDINVNEGDTITIEPVYTDPDNDKVTFTYSGWMDSNTKKTDFGDAGEYYVKVIATDGYHESTDFIKIIVNKTNRAPIFDEIKPIEINEDEEFSVLLTAEDPDGNDLRFFSENLPEGAILIDNKFTWKPGFDIADKENPINTINIKFTVTDSIEYRDQELLIDVADINRPPEIINFSEQLTSKIGEKALFFVNAIDPDGDTLTYEWDFSVFEKYDAGPKMRRTFSSKGEKTIKLKISDNQEIKEHKWVVEVI